ncbi:NUDIX hydrolase [bacterium]|nr:MAG: NUDIX hydrolase [bacterium]
MSPTKKMYGLPILNLQNVSEIMAKKELSGFRKLAPAMPLEKYLEKKFTKTEEEELRFVPKVEVVKFKDPKGNDFNGFRNLFKNGVLVFALLPGDLLPICAEFKHGCERVMLCLPSGLIEPGDKNPEVAAKREFKEEMGITLRKLVLLNRQSIPVDARVSTRQNYFFLGMPSDPLGIKKQKREGAEFIERFLVSIDNWLKFMEAGLVDECSMAATLLALRKLKICGYSDCY